MDQLGSPSSAFTSQARVVHQLAALSLSICSPEGSSLPDRKSKCREAQGWARAAPDRKSKCREAQGWARAAFGNRPCYVSQSERPLGEQNA